METSHEGGRTLAQVIAHWQSVVLVGLSVAGGLTLTVMVIGSAPSLPAQASPVEVPVVAVEPVSAPSTEIVAEPTTVPEVGVDAVEVPAADDATVAVVPASSGAAVLTPTGAIVLEVPTPAPAPAAPAPIAATPAPAAAPAPAPAAPAPAATAPPAPAPTAARPAPAATPAPAPARPAPTTAAPTTAAPTTTTTAPTTVPAAALSYPTYSVSGIGSVGLQFDGSAIYVASVSPQANWVFEIDRNGPRTVEVKFFNVATEREGEFHASVERGRIKVES